ncbi:MAG TPA: hypothetical protein VFP72_09435 [Kineosporiaceae bacterium]|nr:hypothetical protein [Kineosporiaceae bacterium]
MPRISSRRGSGRALALTAALAATVLTMLVPAGPAAARTAPATRTRSTVLTFYSWPDNDPAGTAIAHPGAKGSRPRVRHRVAGGTGTYADPVTVAMRHGVVPVGTRMYLARLRKYGIVEDDCASCRGWWVDVWMGGSADRSAWDDILACEDAATPDGPIPVVFDPPADLPVRTVPLFDNARRRCRAPQD